MNERGCISHKSSDVEGSGRVRQLDTGTEETGRADGQAGTLKENHLNIGNLIQVLGETDKA